MKTSQRKIAVFVATTVMACMLAAVPSFAQIGTDTTSGTFQTNNQSIWASGQSFNFNYNPSIGTSFGAGLNTGGCPALCAGLDLSGSLGLNIGVNIDSGSVSASVPFSSTVTYPTTVHPFASFTPAAAIGLGSSTFMTTGPNAGAYASLYGSLNASGYLEIAGGKLSGTIVNTSFNQPLLTLSGGNAYILGQQVNWNGTYGPVTFNFNPALNGTSASGFGTITTGLVQTDVAHAGIDLAQVLGDYTGIPVSGNIGALNWTLISASLTLDTYFDQKFGFMPYAWADLHVVQTGQDDYCYPGFGCGPITAPAYKQQLTIIPEYFTSAIFSNNTGFQLAPGYDVSLLSAQFNLCCGLSLPALGPAAEWSNNWPLPEISVYNNTFQLQGFQEIDGQPFTITATPEPGTLIMFGSGMLGLAGILRRKLS